MNAPAIPVATEREFDHPLRAIPWLRKLPDNNWTAIGLTALLSLFCALAFTAIGYAAGTRAGFAEHLRFSLVYSFAIGYSIHLISRVVGSSIRSRLNKRPFFMRLMVDMAVWIGGALLGFAIAATVLNQSFHELDDTIIGVLSGTILLSVITGISLRQHALQEIRQERERAEQSEVQRTLVLSRLRLLQAQIEPHFLFNTLANVSSLIDADPKRARVMLDQFTLLLRALLDQTRQSSTSLRKELQVAEAYLTVLKIRMGERLTYRIDVPAELTEVEVPSMLLQPIVENAVKHGIEPLMQGGTVRIAVTAEADRLVLAVEDNGMGFTPTAQDSVGLGAIRERLAVQFGGHAALDIARTDAGWTRVAIRIPMPHTPQGALP